MKPQSFRVRDRQFTYNRLMNRFPDDFKYAIIGNDIVTVQQKELHRDHSPNYWHSSDYMQHRLIGPVVLQVYESDVLQPGIYSATPKVTHWEAPEFIMSDAFLEDMDAWTTASLKKAVAEGGDRTKRYAAMLEKGWWDIAGKSLVLPTNRPSAINYPLPGHILVSNVMDVNRVYYPDTHPLYNIIYNRDW